MTPEMEALKTRLKAMWMAGDYGHFAKYLEPGAMEFSPACKSRQASACWMSRAGRVSSPCRLRE
jgi:hypothetical protein